MEKHKTNRTVREIDLINASKNEISVRFYLARPLLNLTSADPNGIFFVEGKILSVDPPDSYANRPAYAIKIRLEDGRELWLHDKWIVAEEVLKNEI